MLLEVCVLLLGGNYSPGMDWPVLHTDGAEESEGGIVPDDCYGWFSVAIR